MSRRAASRVSPPVDEDSAAVADLLGSDNEEFGAVEDSIGNFSRYKPRNRTNKTNNNTTQANTAPPTLPNSRPRTGDFSLDAELGALGLSVQLPTGKKNLTKTNKPTAGGSFDVSDSFDSPDGYELSADQIRMNAAVQQARTGQVSEIFLPGEENKKEKVEDKKAKYKEMKAKRAAERSPHTSTRSSDPFGDDELPLDGLGSEASKAPAPLGNSSRTRRPVGLGNSTNSAPSPAAVVDSRDSVSSSGSAVPPTLDRWYEWLSINPRSPDDKFLLSVANRAFRAKLPAHYKMQNGLYINTKTGRKSEKHPLIPHFQKKLGEKRLKLRFGITDDSNEEDEDLGESELETSREISKSNKIDQNNQNPLSPLASPSAGKSRLQATPANKGDFPASPQTQQPQATTAPQPSSSSSSKLPVNLPPASPAPSLPYYGNSPAFDEILASQSARVQALVAESRSNKAPPVVAPPAGASDSALMATVRSQAARLEFLESRKDSLLHELEVSHGNTLALLNEQRVKLQAEAGDQLSRLQMEYESYKRARERERQSLAEELRDSEEKVRLSELRKQQAIQSAIAESEARGREALDHAVRLQAVTLQQQQKHHEREIDSIRSLHQKEMAALQAQLSDSKFIKALASQIESSSKSIEFLHSKVATERSSFEKSSEEQLAIREKILREHSAQLEGERRALENLRQTFEALKKDGEGERLRLAEDRAKFNQIQADLKAESEIIKEQFQIERENIREERRRINEERDAWKILHAKQLRESEQRLEQAERQTRLAAQQVDELSQQRSSAFQDIDQERELLKEDRKLLELKKVKLIEAENSLRGREAAQAATQEELEKKMADFSELGARMKAKSAQLNELALFLQQEKASITALHKKNQEILEEIKNNKKFTEEETVRMQEQKKILQKQKLDWLKEQKGMKNFPIAIGQRAPSTGNFQSLEEFSRPQLNSQQTQKPISPADFNLLGAHNDLASFSASQNFSSPPPPLNSSHAALRRALHCLVEDSKRSASFIESANLPSVWQDEKEAAEFSMPAAPAIAAVPQPPLEQKNPMEMEEFDF